MLRAHVCRRYERCRYRRSALHKLFLLQRSACAIEPGTSRRMTATRLFSCLIVLPCRAAAAATSYGDEKALYPALSKVRSSGCVRWGRVKSGSSRKKKWKHARLRGRSDAEVCVSASVAPLRTPAYPPTMSPPQDVCVVYGPLGVAY